MHSKKLLILSLLLYLFTQFINAQYKDFIYKDSIRQYAVYEPDLEPNPNGYPLVIGLHGSSSEGYALIATTSLASKAIKEKFIIAAPNGLKYNFLTWWNAGGLYEDITGGTDDIGFIGALIDTMIKNYNVDTTRIYVMGFSNGAAMAYRVAAELSYKIAALGVSSGQMLYEYCDPEFPVPIIHFHGLDDDKFPYYGAGDSVVIPPVDSTMAVWRKINGCSDEYDTVFYNSDSAIVGKKWTSSNGLNDIILYTKENGVHEWPRPANWDLSATDIIWDFFMMHTRNDQPDIKSKIFTYDGERRTYLVYDPQPGSGTRPLLIGLHCHTGSALGFLSYTSWIQKADEENFIGVFPNALFQPIGTAWNVGSSWEQFTLGTDDVGFISALIDTMINSYDIDTTRIYATGHSNGSMMSYRLAAELSPRIAAIGCVAAPMLYEFADPEFSVPIIHFHGLSDTTMPYEGKVEKFCIYPPMDSTLATWRKINKCSDIPEILLDNNGIIGKKWPSDDGKGDIILYTIETCMHDWPVVEKYGIDATDEIWDFLKQQIRIPKSTISGSDNQKRRSDFILYQNYPNPFSYVTQINYHLNESCDISIKIINLTGQEVDILVDEFQTAGDHIISWYPKNLAAGIYFYRIQINTSLSNSGQGYTEIKKLILL